VVALREQNRYSPVGGSARRKGGTWADKYLLSPGGEGEERNLNFTPSEGRERVMNLTIKGNRNRVGRGHIRAKTSRELH